MILCLRARFSYPSLVMVNSICEVIPKGTIGKISSLLSNIIFGKYDSPDKLKSMYLVVESFINKDTVFEKLPAYLNDTLIYTV
jgi:hypothetical protein